MYGFLRQPKWLAAHALVLVLLPTFIGAGIWQYTRHLDRQGVNDAAAARAALVDLDETSLASISANNDEYRGISVLGVWSPDDAVIIRNRSRNGAAGCHLAVPFDTVEAVDLLVVAGWLTETSCVSTGTDYRLPAGQVQLTARLRATQTRGSLGPRDAAEGRLESLARTDVARIDQQVDLALAELYGELIEAAPLVEGVAILEAPSLEAGPHLGYAVQWFLFFVVGAVGYPIVLRHHARRGDLDDVPEPTPPAS